MIDALHRFVYRHGYKLARRYWRLTRARAEGATVAVLAEDRLLVVRHSYTPGFGLPAGGIAKGEAPRAAARRELMEETGIEAAETALAPAFVHRFEVHGRQITNHVFELRLDTCVAPHVDRRELIWAGWRDPKALVPERCNATLRRYLRVCVNKTET